MPTTTSARSAPLPAAARAAAPAWWQALHGVGAGVQRSLRRATGTLDFLGQVVLALARLLRGRSQMRAGDLLLQLDQTGPRSVPIVALVCALVGLILAYMGAAQLLRFGAQSFIADLVAVGVVREIAALMTGIILSGRVGAAFAAQLATMQANDEIDALRTMGIDPIDHLVLPRVLALGLIAPLLTAIGAVVGVAAGWGVSLLAFGIETSDFLARSAQALTPSHVLVGLVKGTVYAVLVGLAGCREGLESGRSARAVGEATTLAVVKSIVWIVAVASVLTVLLQRLGW